MLARGRVRDMKKLCLLLALAALSACATTTDAPIVENGPAAPAGTLVGLDQPVWVGGIVATPKEVIEDSRCPENARCVQAGKLVVRTRFDGPGWRETAPLTLGQPMTIHGTRVTLVSGVPEKRADRDTAAAEYRFAYEAD